MPNEFRQIDWDDALEDECRRIVRLAIDEDLGDVGDLTSRALVPENLQGRAAVVARQAGVIAGLPAAEVALGMIDPRLVWTAELRDGDSVEPGGRVAVLGGPPLAMLAAERLVLNILGRLSGVASLARKYVEAVAGTKARIYDTRKTTPGWRRLEKYAVRCGGGWNHRTGLFDAVLIKDNHLALGAASKPAGTAGGAENGSTVAGTYSPAEAVAAARRFVESHVAEPVRSRMVVEIEVDTLQALEEVLPAGPDVVLLDNMSPEELTSAVALRDAAGSSAVLEASGGVNLATVAAAAASGVDRISVGALTHSAPCLDVGLDWLSSYSISGE